MLRGRRPAALLHSGRAGDVVRAADVLGGTPSAVSVSDGAYEDPDTPEFGRALAWALTRSAAHPVALAAATGTLAARLARLAPDTVRQMFAAKGSPSSMSNPGDRRFADAAWQENPAFFALHEAYVAACRLGDDVIAAGSGDQVGDSKARMANQILADSLAPTNFLLPTRQPCAGRRRPAAELGRGCGQLPHRPQVQWRQTAAGRQQLLRGRPKPGRHAGQGGVPQRLDGADPVRAPDRAGARNSAARRPALDQQVLRHGPGTRTQLLGMGRAARADRVRDQLSQRRRHHARRDDGRLPRPRAAARDGRHRRHHRLVDRPRRTVHRRRHDGDDRGVPGPQGARTGRHRHAAQHPAGLSRPRRAGGLHRRRGRWPGWSSRWRAPASSTARRWPAPSTPCGPTS